VRMANLPTAAARWRWRTGPSVTIRAVSTEGTSGWRRVRSRRDVATLKPSELRRRATGDVYYNNGGVLTRQPCLPFRRRARRPSAHHPVTAAARPWPHPMARASKRRVPHRSLGSPAWPWGGYASEQLAGLPPARTMRTRTLESRKLCATFVDHRTRPSSSPSHSA
jgi:hypothetical protein